MKKAFSTEMDGKRTPIAVWILAMAVGLVLLALVWEVRWLQMGCRQTVMQQTQ